MKPDYLELAEHLSTLYDRCQDERAVGARAAILELRNAVPEVVAALRTAAAREADYVEIPYLDLSKVKPPKK